MSDESDEARPLWPRSRVRTRRPGHAGRLRVYIGLAIFGVVTYFIVVAMYSFSRSLRAFAHGTASPLVTSKGAMSRVVTQAIWIKRSRTTALPCSKPTSADSSRLPDESGEAAPQLWLGRRKRRVARIPIERAMELIVQRGLPVYPQGSAEQRRRQRWPARPPAPSAGKEKQCAVKVVSRTGSPQLCL